MRYLFMLTLAISLGCNTSQNVTNTDEPDGETTGIILTVNSSPDHTFSNLADYLSQRGFKLKQVDHYERYLRTDFKPMDEEMYTFSIEAVVPPSDSTVVVFRGEAIGPHVQSSARIRKEMGRLNTNLWDRFHQTVIEFPHENVYYSTD